MTASRGMSIADAKLLAGNPATAEAVLTRLANGYPEVWEELRANPSVSPELRKWIEQSKPATPKPKKNRAIRTRRVRSRGRRKFGRIARSITLLIVPAMAIYGLWFLLKDLEANRPAQGIVAMETLSAVNDNPSWRYDLATSGDSDCTAYEFATMDQGQAIVLTQNDLETKKCKDLKNPIPSTLALVRLSTGQVIWKIDLAGELDWTEKWQKQIVEIPGLNQVLVKYTDINGTDADDGKKSIDDSKSRKMKTLVPYNRLNGLITDPVIAKSKYQPIMQAPVLEVLPIPGDLKSVLVMTNGSKKDFRFAKYRSKRLSSAKWSLESDLKPIGGNPIVGNRLILGRDKKDEPKSIFLGAGKFGKWGGKSAVKIYRIGSTTIQIAGDGVKEKATNLLSQGGTEGNDVTISSLDEWGNETWSIDAKGYAISQDDSLTNPFNRRDYSQLFVLGGKNNRKISKVDVESGEFLWSMNVSKERFEISRLSSNGLAFLYLNEKNKFESKLFSTINLLTGQESSEIKIAGKSVRIDGQTVGVSVLVDEPSRSKLISNLESGKRINLTSSEKESKKVRICARGINNVDSSELWSFDCKGSQHVTRVAGSWILVDLSEGSEEFWLLGGNL